MCVHNFKKTKKNNVLLFAKTYVWKISTKTKLFFPEIKCHYVLGYIVQCILGEFFYNLIFILSWIHSNVHSSQVNLNVLANAFDILVY